MKLRVVLVEPRYEGNVGAVARSMKNFGFSDLVLVRPCELGSFCMAMAAHAKDILQSARSVDRLEDALEGASLVVGTTGKRLGRDHHHLRLHLRVPFLTPSELAERLRDKDGTVALLLGREDWGLTNDELMACDVLVSIPTSDDYPVMNLSHAATVILYELGQVDSTLEVRLAARDMLERIYESTDHLLRIINYPEHKIRYVVLMLRRIFGRAELTEREANTLLGVIKKAIWKVEGDHADRRAD
ncbi:MAG: RNA methyltransferase [Methanothrix sp.]|jgi:TrmH family RNA methyltransferase|uniref:RNA methyltransferase n=1 Tax=Methanothrix sp. TaxID=90426 RepID=UPI00247C2A03|nr:RNA methyltransferase [Methanothrix sp.]